jgi:hypothetical protein
MPCIRLAKPPRLHATEECARRLETAAPAQSKAPESLPSACSNGVDRAHRGGGRIRPRVRSRHHGALSPETQAPGRSSVQRQKRPPRQRRPEAERAVGWSFLLEVLRNSDPRQSADHRSFKEPLQGGKGAWSSVVTPSSWRTRSGRRVRSRRVRVASGSGDSVGVSASLLMHDRVRLAGR